ncbi:hypothetical protein Tco_0797315 [Tanacetum coccineum]
MAFKSPEGEKVQQTYTRLKMLLNDLENKDVKFPQAEDKGLVIESFDWDEESLSYGDDKHTTVKAFMTMFEDEPSIGKSNARCGTFALYYQGAEPTEISKDVLKVRELAKTSIVFDKAKQNSDNSYLRDILGDILGKDMHH